MLKDELKEIAEHRDRLVDNCCHSPMGQRFQFLVNDCNTLFATMNVMIDALEWYGNKENYLLGMTVMPGPIEGDRGERARYALKGFE